MNKVLQRILLAIGIIAVIVLVSRDWPFNSGDAAGEYSGAGGACECWGVSADGESV